MKKILKAIWEFLEGYGVTILLLAALAILSYLCMTL